MQLPLIPIEIRYAGPIPMQLNTTIYLQGFLTVITEKAFGYWAPIWAGRL
jgi:hypothetical protein